MSFINRGTAIEIIKNNGYYLEEIRAVKIIEYENPAGEVLYALLGPHDEPDRYVASVLICNPRVYWQVL